MEENVILLYILFLATIFHVAFSMHMSFCKLFSWQQKEFHVPHHLSHHYRNKENNSPISVESSFSNSLYSNSSPSAIC